MELKSEKLKIKGEIKYVSPHLSMKDGGTFRSLSVEVDDKHSDLQGVVKVNIFFYKRHKGPIKQIMRKISDGTTEIEIPHTNPWTGDIVEIIGRNYVEEFHSIVFESGMLIKETTDPKKRVKL